MAIFPPTDPLRPLPWLIFSSRWLQLPLYLGLIVAQGVYVFLFLKELAHLVTDIRILDEQQVMLVVLGLIDVVMISNLLMMVIVGGYETFVSRMRLERHPDQPEWLSHVNANVLKTINALPGTSAPRSASCAWRRQNSASNARCSGATAETSSGEIAAMNRKSPSISQWKLRGR